MADKTGIEWTDATWNPVVGCSLVSPGCTNCYAMGQAARIVRCAAGLGRTTHYEGTVREAKGKPVWTGTLALAPDSILLQPLRWKAPRKIFVNSMGDLFHEDVPDAWIDRVFAVMALTPQHTYQVLTKRAARMRAYLSDPTVRERIALAGAYIINANAGVRIAAQEWFARRDGIDHVVMVMPLPNVWLGVSAEDQARADERVPELLATPAAVRFVSAEPLLGPIDFSQIDMFRQLRQAAFMDALDGGLYAELPRPPRPPFPFRDVAKLDWIIVGGESGPGARPMHPDWARDIRDQCAAAGAAFFFKQWGEWAPGECADFTPTRSERVAQWFDGKWSYYALTPKVSEEMHRDDEPDVYRIGKRRSWRKLDGVEHDAMPELRHG